MARYLLFAVACLFLASLINGLETVNGKIKITVQTTAGCGDTVRFFENHLAPAYELYKDYLELDFVPWGRASRNEQGDLTCQFGVNDCWANRLHRCALHLLEGDQDAQMHYMTCEFSVPRAAFDNRNYLCAHAVGLSLVKVDHCVASTGDELDRIDEVRGSEMTSVIDFIPSVVFNDEIDKDQHDQAIQRLPNMVCLALAADPTIPVSDCQI